MNGRKWMSLAIAVLVITAMACRSEATPESTPESTPEVGKSPRNPIPRGLKLEYSDVFLVVRQFNRPADDSFTKTMFKYNKPDYGYEIAGVQLEITCKVYYRCKVDLSNITVVGTKGVVYDHVHHAEFRMDDDISGPMIFYFVKQDDTDLVLRYEPPPERSKSVAFLALE